MNHCFLIVDDEELIRQGIIARIEYLNFGSITIYEAENGRQALEVLQNHEVDIVITDIRMADMDGLTLIRGAKTLHPRVQFIILSGYSEFAYAEQAIRLGVNAYLLKPISNEELKNAIDEVILKLEEGNNLIQKVWEGNRSIAERKNYFLAKNINDLLREEDLANRKQIVESVNLEFPFMDKWFMLAIINVDGDSYERRFFKHNDNDLILFTIQNIVMELESKSDKMITNNLNNKNQLYTLITNKNESQLRKDAELLFTRLQNIMWKKMGVSLTIGISSEIKSLTKECAKQAQEAFMQRLIQGNSNIFFYNDIKYFATNQFPTAELNMLCQYIERYDLVNIEHMINKIFSEDQVKKYNFTFIRIAWIRIISILLKVVNSSFAQDSKHLERLVLNTEILDSVRSLDELKSNLYLMILGCIQYDGDLDLNSKSKIKLAIKYIYDNYNTDIAINEIAEKFALSPNYFSALFKRETGQTTVNFIKDIRIKKACDYLTTSDKSVVEISQEVGYDDNQYFFRVFKKATGETPLAYRKTHKI